MIGDKASDHKAFLNAKLKYFINAKKNYGKKALNY